MYDFIDDVHLAMCASRSYARAMGPKIVFSQGSSPNSTSRAFAAATSASNVG
jgi:hypothetical protein